LEQQITENERHLVGLIATRWQDPLTFEVDGGWFKAVAAGRSWETSREDINRYFPPELDALARQALVTMSGAQTFWPPLQNQSRNQPAAS
jgi:hypothetical protein